MPGVKIGNRNARADGSRSVLQSVDRPGLYNSSAAKRTTLDTREEAAGIVYWHRLQQRDFGSSRAYDLTRPSRAFITWQHLS